MVNRCLYCIFILLNALSVVLHGCNHYNTLPVFLYFSG
nr:MAG TPA: hypothetical protein [Caudoviricetes sp.]